MDLPEQVFLWHNNSLGDQYYSIVLSSCTKGESHKNPYIVHIKNPDKDDSVLYIISPDNALIDLPALHKMSEEELFQEGLIADYPIPYDYMLRLVRTIMKNYEECTNKTRIVVEVLE